MLKAKAILKQYGPVSEGTDYSTSPLDHVYPDDNIWLVAYQHPDLVSVVFGDKNTTADNAALIARKERASDADQCVVVVAKDFFGNETLFKHEGAF